MESNGKRVTVDGTVLPFEAGEVDFGAFQTLLNRAHSSTMNATVFSSDLFLVTAKRVAALLSTLQASPAPTASTPSISSSTRDEWCPATTWVRARNYPARAYVYTHR